MRGRVALVTGGSGGIGAALCERLAAAGARVAVHYAINRPEVDAPVFQADLREREAPDRLIDAVEAELGPVDILAANAGLSRPAPYEDVDAAMFDETLAVNLRAPFLLARRCCPAWSSAATGGSCSPPRSRR